MRRARTMESGFTLIELLAATALLVIGMTGILALFTTALRLESEAEQRIDVALALPEALREVERRVGQAMYGAPAGAKGQGKPAASGEFALAGAGGTYRCRWTTEAAPGHGDVRGVIATITLLPGPSGDDIQYDFGRLPIVPEAPPPGAVK